MQNLVGALRDVRDDEEDAEVSALPGFTEFVAEPGAGGRLRLAFASHRLEGAVALALYRWDVEVDASGAIDAQVRPIGELPREPLCEMRLLPRLRDVEPARPSERRPALPRAARGSRLRLAAVKRPS